MGGKRIMGLPLPVWLGVAAAGLLLGIYLRKKGSGSTVAPATSYPLSIPTSQGSIDNGVSGGGLSPASGTGVDPSVFNDWMANEGAVAAQLGSLTDAIGQLVYNVPSSGGSGSSGTGKDPYSTPTNDPLIGNLSGVPVMPKPSAPTLPKQVVKKAPAPTRYYTYKKNVPLVGGKSIHFTSGKGYYAA